MDDQVNTEARSLRFGEFELDVPGRLLSRNGEQIKLPPRIHTLLEYFVERPGTAVTRDELIDELWQGVAVSDQSLTEAVWRLRRALGDEPKDPKYIETIPGFGFRFVATVEEVGEEAVDAGSDWVPLWKLALPGALLSGLMLLTGVGAVYLWAGGAPGERVRLTEVSLPDGRPVSDFRAELSPQDDRLAFVQSDPPRLEVLDLNSEETVILGALPRVWDGRQLRWSPDGSVLALSDLPDPGGAGRVELFDLGSGARRTLAERPGGQFRLLGWSPAGDRLLVLSTDADRQQLTLLDLAGAIRGEWAVEGVEDGRVSPDGRWLALWVFADPDQGLDGEIVIAPIAGIWDAGSQPAPDAFVGWPNSARISDPPAHDKAYWNKSSDQFIYFSNRGDGRALWYVELDGGRPVRQPRLLEMPGDPYMVQGWMADGRILFCSFDTGWDVFVAGFDPETMTLASEPALVSLWEGSARLTLWSHEPDRLMYASFHEDPAEGDLYLAAFSGDPIQPLAGEPERVSVEGPFAYPQWDSERGLVYYSRRVRGRGSEIRVLDLASGQDTQLLPQEVLAGFVRLTLDREGRSFLFDVHAKPRPWLPDPTLDPGLYLYEIGTGSVRQIVTAEGRTEWAFDLSPDGTRVALSDAANVELQLIDIATGTREVLATVPASGWTIRSISFLPDGETLSYTIARDLPESFCGESEVWLVDAAGGEPARLEGVASYDPQGGDWSSNLRRFAFSAWKCNSTVKLFAPF